LELDLEIIKGGEGSGHHGHAGRPGLVGGSGPGGNQTAPKVSEVRSISDLKKIADISLPKDSDKYEYFYHAVRFRSMIDSIEKDGIKLNNAGRIYASKDEVRDLGSGFVIFRATPNRGEEGVDVVEQGLTYRQWTFVEPIPMEDVLRTVREVPIVGTQHTIREDHLAKYALENQGGGKDVDKLPVDYQRWFRVGKKEEEKKSDNPYQYLLGNLPPVRRRRRRKKSVEDGGIVVPGYMVPLVKEVLEGKGVLKKKEEKK